MMSIGSKKATPNPSMMAPLVSIFLPVISVVFIFKSPFTY
jgi:hypothetical protein